MRENRLRWFRHIYCRSVDAVVKSDMVNSRWHHGSTKERDRPKWTLEVVVQKNLGLFDISEHDAPIDLYGENGFM